MGLFSNLKKLRLKDIGTGKNLKKIGKGIKQMKFGEGLGLLGLGLGGAGLFGAGPLGNMLGGAGKWLGGGIKNLAGNKFVQKQAMSAAKGALQKSLVGQAPLQGAMPPMMPQANVGERYSSTYTPNPMTVNPNIDYSQQNIGGYGGGWTG
jgi:hypothetical protein